MSFFLVFAVYFSIYSIVGLLTLLFIIYKAARKGEFWIDLKNTIEDDWDVYLLLWVLIALYSLLKTVKTV